MQESEKTSHKPTKRIASMANLAKDVGLVSKPEPKPKKNGRPAKTDIKPVEQDHVTPIEHVAVNAVDLGKTDNVKAVFKLKYSPRGKAYMLYQVAAFKLNGGYTPNRKGMNVEELSKVFTNKKHIDKMVEANWLEFTKDGKVRLSELGYKYVKSQMDGHIRSKVFGLLVDCLVNAMQTGIWEGRSMIFPTSSTHFVKI